jgi:hypothetical protein
VIPSRSMFRSNAIKALTLLFVLSCCASIASAQSSITVSVSPAAVNWSNLLPGSATNTGSAPVVVTTSWNLSPAGGGFNLKVFAYFNSSTVAMAHSAACVTGCGNIPSSAFEIGLNGAAFSSVTGTGPFGAAGASFQIASVPITGTNKSSSRVDTLQLNLNLSTLPTLPADTYSGVLNIQAQSLP